MTARTDMLPSAIVRHNELKAELLLQFNSLADDPEALLDTAEGVGSPLPDLLKRIVWEIRRIEREEKSLKDRRAELATRGAALEQRRERLRALVAHGMTEGGITKLDDCEWSAGISDAKPKLVITNEGEIPERFWFQPQPKPLVIDRVEVYQAVTAGEEVPGAHLSNGGTTLTIRPKKARKEAAE